MREKAEKVGRLYRMTHVSPKHGDSHHVNPWPLVVGVLGLALTVTSLLLNRVWHTEDVAIDEIRQRLTRIEETQLQILQRLPR
jgi:hypothetical protein